MLTYPLTLAAFFEQLPIMDMALDLPEAVEMSRLGSGEILTADLGARLWSGQVSLGKMTRAEIAGSRALINSLRGVGRSFLAFDATRPFPLADPDGALLGASTPVIASLPAGSLTLTLSGLPVGYEISAGDLIGWTYGTIPLRYALHEVATGGTAAAGGVTPEIELTSFIRAGALVGAAVRLVRAPFKAVIIPGTVQPGTTRRSHTEGSTFAFQQTLR